MHQIAEIAGVILGVIYLVQELKASRSMWITGMLMPLISMYVYFKAGLYADFGIDIYYFLAAVYGYVVWKRGEIAGLAGNDGQETGSDGQETGNDKKKTGNDKKKTGNNGQKTGNDGKAELPITRTPLRVVPALGLLFAVAFAAISFILIRWTDSTVPLWDSLTTSLSIVGLFMLARKWLEQWWVWVVVDLVSSCLYIYKGIPFYAGLYGLYTVVAVYGWFRWRKNCKTTGTLKIS